MTTENGKELGGHHCPDWDGLWVTPSSPEHEACTCYIGSAMTTNKQLRGLVDWQPIETAPHVEEVLLGWLEWDGAWKMEVSQASWGWSTKTASNISRHGQATHWMPLPDAPQSSEPPAALSGLPDSLPMEPYQTVDRSSPHYKAGWNACRRAMLAALEKLIGGPNP